MGGGFRVPSVEALASLPPLEKEFQEPNLVGDGNTGGPGDPWSSGAQLQGGPYVGYGPSSLLPSGPNSHLAQPAFPPPPMHLSHDPMGYGAISPGGGVPSQTDPGGMLGPQPSPVSSLPPMSSFRGGGVAGPGPGGQVVPPATTSSSPATALYGSHSPAGPVQPHTSESTIGKALASIYPTDQSVSSYSSNPSTPVSSPPPLTGGNAGQPWNAAHPPSSPHYTADRTIHMASTTSLTY
uniref:Uncharacterized protein n=1 Tax=Timema shepardi TaxID=629360 RepID=A0A7R9B9M2_TIMSH|nr:unnamed protein product [Timema shepardi]